MTPFLTIGMAAIDNYEQVWFTIQALRMYHADVLDDAEILLVNNNPLGKATQALKDLIAKCPQGVYAEFSDWKGTACRNEVFSRGSGEFIFCIDSHILFAPGSLSKLVEYLKSNRQTMNLIQGPMWYDELAPTHVATSFNTNWEDHMYGQWENDPRGSNANSPPFPIRMQGLGLFGCRKDAWLGFNPLFRGFGGEEGYIHAKFKQHGRETICLPFLRWPHLFHRECIPMRYPLSLEDKIRNYFLGWYELGLDEEQVIRHFSTCKKNPKKVPVLKEMQATAHRDWDAWKARQATTGQTVPSGDTASQAASGDHSLWAQAQAVVAALATHNATMKGQILQELKRQNRTVYALAVYLMQGGAT
jgi:hypothetical protein